MQTNIAARQGFLGQILRRNRLLLCLILLHLSAAISVSAYLDVPFQSGTVFQLMIMFKTLVPVFLLVLMFWRFADLVCRIRPARPTLFFVQDIQKTICDPDRIVSGLIAFFCIALFASCFAFLKDMIPLIAPFSWDPMLAEIDRTLHGGYDPYQLLMPLFGTPTVTTVLNAAYHFWFFLFYFLIFVACFDKHNTERRNLFLVAFVLTWIVGGNLLATVFSSVGPVYYAPMGLGDNFTPLMTTLYEFAETSPVWALSVQEMLLDGYQTNGPVKGISAMPSMHVASSAIMALFGFSYARWLGWALSGFTAIIMLGSIQLGWHYAIDGYAGILVAFWCWAAAKRLLICFG